jgi:hypothetical protein
LALNEGGGIPAPPNLNNPALVYDVWVLWMATGRRFLPSQLLAEPTALLDDVLQLDGLYNSLKDLMNDRKDD